MARTLASIQRITALNPIEGADAIEVADVLGWKVVVKKGEYQVGDLAIYMEIDSVPPDEEEYRFLWKFAEQRPNNFRIKTIKLRGQISQGILFPVPKYERDPEVYKFWPFDPVWAVEGADVTELLGVTKYEAPLPRGSDDIAGQFFDGVPKTDEERVQSSTGRKHLAALQGRPYYITVKCDGSSMTVASHDGVPKVASRNYRLADNPDSAYWNAARNGNLLRFVELYPHMAVQGELCGPGIQSNRLGLSHHRCLVFNVYNRDLGVYLPYDTIADIAQEFFFDTVPLLEFGLSFNYDADDLLYMAEGKYEGTKSEREGIVIRNDDDGPFTSFKAISNRYLLKGGE
jgi:RNA ligase (TIGR02306 family)